MNEDNGTDPALEPEVMETLPVAYSPVGAEVDVQVTTAKRFPRSLTQFKRDLLTEVTADQETAGSMFYALPRGGKRIEGPSARFAEAAAYAWGNIRAQGDIESEDDDFVYASAIAWDLEKNVAIKVRTRRRIRDSKNKRYDIDLIGVTGGAATSVALRNAILKAIPRSAWWPAYLEARKASLGKAGTIQQKRQNALGWFAKIGVSEEQVCARLEVAGVDDIGEEELILLRGLRTALEEGDTTVERAFPRAGSEPGQAGSLNDKLAQWKAENGPEKSPAEPDAAEGSPGPESTAGESVAEGEAGDDSEEDEDSDEVLARLEARYSDLVLEFRPTWTDEHKRLFEVSTFGSPEAEWDTVAEYEKAIKVLSQAGPLPEAKRKRAKA